MDPRKNKNKSPDPKRTSTNSSDPKRNSVSKSPEPKNNVGKSPEPQSNPTKSPKGNVNKDALKAEKKLRKQMLKQLKSKIIETKANEPEIRWSSWNLEKDEDDSKANLTAEQLEKLKQFEKKQNVITQVKSGNKKPEPEHPKRNSLSDNSEKPNKSQPHHDTKLSPEGKHDTGDKPRDLRASFIDDHVQDNKPKPSHQEPEKKSSPPPPPLPISSRGWKPAPVKPKPIQKDALEPKPTAPPSPPPTSSPDPEKKSEVRKSLGKSQEPKPTPVVPVVPVPNQNQIEKSQQEPRKGSLKSDNISRQGQPPEKSQDPPQPTLPVVVPVPIPNQTQKYKLEPRKGPEKSQLRQSRDKSQDPTQPTPLAVPVPIPIIPNKIQKPQRQEPRNISFIADNKSQERQSREKPQEQAPIKSNPQTQIQKSQVSPKEPPPAELSAPLGNQEISKLSRTKSPEPAVPRISKDPKKSSQPQRPLIAPKASLITPADPPTQIKPFTEEPPKIAVANKAQPLASKSAPRKTSAVKEQKRVSIPALSNQQRVGRRKSLENESSQPESLESQSGSLKIQSSSSQQQLLSLEGSSGAQSVSLVSLDSQPEINRISRLREESNPPPRKSTAYQKLITKVAVPFKTLLHFLTEDSNASNKKSDELLNKKSIDAVKGEISSDEDEDNLSADDEHDEQLDSEWLELDNDLPGSQRRSSTKG